MLMIFLLPAFGSACAYLVNLIWPKAAFKGYDVMPFFDLRLPADDQLKGRAILFTGRLFALLHIDIAGRHQMGHDQQEHFLREDVPPVLVLPGCLQFLLVLRIAFGRYDLTNYCQPLSAAGSFLIFSEICFCFSDIVV